MPDPTPPRSDDIMPELCERAWDSLVVRFGVLPWGCEADPIDRTILYAFARAVVREMES